jgi:tRNA modification GTPase
VLFHDTIAAISTPPGIGGIGIIRVSGPDAGSIGRLLFLPVKKIERFESHHLYHGDIVSTETGHILDEVLLAFMKGPHSYTGEDTLEIHCHGGPLILQSVLREVVKAGARPAEPGEFSHRALLNNRLDLAQAEAIQDMISAKTEKGLDLAVAQLKGTLSRTIQSAHDAIMNLLVTIEASIDFTDDCIETSPSDIPIESIQGIISKMEELLTTYREGRLYRDGIHIVIAGRTNVGKSSLLNRLLGEKRAIVTPIAGTTRDFIEESINIHGMPAKIADTAGIRPAHDAIEEEGISLVWEKVSMADIVIILLDGNDILYGDDLEIIKKNQERKIILAINKSDLSRKLSEEELVGILPGVEPIRISAKYGDGIPLLKDRIFSLMTGTGETHQRGIMIANLRHKTAIEQAKAALERAEDSLKAGLSPEFAAFDIHTALDRLGEITGKTTNEDVLERIFATFCIGK